MSEKITIVIKPLQLFFLSLIIGFAIITSTIIFTINNQNHNNHVTIEQIRLEQMCVYLAKLARRKGLMYPVPFSNFNCGFGWRRNPVRKFIGGKLLGFHTGLDLPATNGQEIKSSGDGTVIKLGYNWIAGNYIYVDHEDGLQTMYCHLRKISVKLFSLVCRGEVLGLAGKTGITTGTHLHWGVFFQGVAMNPEFWIAIAE